MHPMIVRTGSAVVSAGRTLRKSPDSPSPVVSDRTGGAARVEISHASESRSMIVHPDASFVRWTLMGEGSAAVGFLFAPKGWDSKAQGGSPGKGGPSADPGPTGRHPGRSGHGPLGLPRLWATGVPGLDALGYRVLPLWGPGKDGVSLSSRCDWLGGVICGPRGGQPDSESPATIAESVSHSFAPCPELASPHHAGMPEIVAC